MKHNKYQISVILPTYNEAGNITDLILAIKKYLKKINHEIIVVDDSSTDQTGYLTEKNFLKDPKVRIFIRKKRGLATAILYGLKKANGLNIAVMDTDFNHDPKELKLMFNQIQKADLVVGSRYVAGGGMQNHLRHYFSSIYNRLIRIILQLPIHDNLSGFFMIKREKLKFIKEDIFRGYGDYFIRFINAANNKKLKIIEIPVYYKNRESGQSKSQLLRMFIDYSKTVFEILRNKR